MSLEYQKGLAHLENQKHPADAEGDGEAPHYAFRKRIQGPEKAAMSVGRHFCIKNLQFCESRFAFQKEK